MGGEMGERNRKSGQTRRHERHLQRHEGSEWTQHIVRKQATYSTRNWSANSKLTRASCSVETIFRKKVFSYISGKTTCRVREVAGDRLPERDGIGELTRQEFEEAVKRLKKNKATGIDGIPVEV